MNCQIVAVLALLVVAGPLRAHHGFQAVYDVSKKHSLSGTLAKVDWRNPHIELWLDAKSESGQIETWVIEAAPPVFFRRHSISKTSFQNVIGQIVTVETYRARDGSLRGSLLKITFADGTSVSNDPSV